MLGFILGLFIGTSLGIFAASLCAMTRQAPASETEEA